MADLPDILEVVDENVRKWGTQLFFIMDPKSPIPDTWFGAEDKLPILPEGALQLGYITTDGISAEDSISSEPTQMLQSLEPTRADLTGIEKTLSVAFGEDNSFVQALWHFVPFEKFPVTKDGPWSFHDGEQTDLPEYRVGWIGMDGVGSAARYRVEFGYRAKVNAKESRTMNRSDPETYGVTFGLFKDKVAKRSYTRLQNGPAYADVVVDEG